MTHQLTIRIVRPNGKTISRKAVDLKIGDKSVSRFITEALRDFDDVRRIEFETKIYDEYGLLQSKEIQYHYEW